MIRESAAEVRILPDDQERPGVFARLTRSGWFMAVASPAILLVLWEGLVRAGLLDARFFPAPSSVVVELVALCRTGELFVHLGYTLSRVAIGLRSAPCPGCWLAW